MSDEIEKVVRPSGDPVIKGSPNISVTRPPRPPRQEQVHPNK